VRVSVAELRRALGPSAMALWQQLSAAADRRRTVRLTRAEMAARSGLSTKQVRAGLTRLRSVRLITRAASRRDPSRTVRGRLIAGDAANVPPDVWRLLRESSGWGGRRDGAGRRRSERSVRASKESSGPYRKNQVGHRGQLTAEDSSEIAPGDGSEIKWALKGPRNSSGPYNGIQVGPSKQGSSPVGGIDQDRSSLARFARSFDGARAGARPSLLTCGVGPESVSDAVGTAVSDDPDVQSECGGGESDVRSLKELLRLDVVPRLLLADGRRAELAIRTPHPPAADAGLEDAAVLAHVARLWRGATRFVSGSSDMRMNGVAAGGRSRLTSTVVGWWRACADKEVAPAAWLVWELCYWRDRHSGRKVQIPGVMSAGRVGDGRVRRLFRISGTSLGGRIRYDPVGLELSRRVQRVERELGRLVAERLGRVTDADVAEIVAVQFPRGASNAAQVLADVHDRCSAESARLSADAARGSFIWADEQ